MMEEIPALQLNRMLGNGEELALLDVREAGQFGIDHMLHAVPCPYSLLETRVPLLVPRQSVRVVLIDEDDGTAEKAAARLQELGYGDVRKLAGGNRAWKTAGFEVFQGVNVPSKAFGEVVEHAAGTPHITADQLHAMMHRGDDFVILDGRTPEEHHRMSIPGGVSAPNAEMIHRIGELAPDPDTTVVVNCAGRTRSIIGAQGLINAGIPNRVVALKDGTMGWTLAGYRLEHGSTNRYPERLTEGGLEVSERYARHFASRFGIESVDLATIRNWQQDDNRTVFLLDVRAEEEFVAGHLAGSVHAPGGQLVQATDQWCGVWGARLVLLDTRPGTRAAITGHWLKQMGWEVYFLENGLDDVPLETGHPPSPPLPVQGATISTGELEEGLSSGRLSLVDVSHSMTYRESHIPGAVWCPRARLDRLEIPEDREVVICSYGETRSRLAASDLRTRTGTRVLEGGRKGWIDEGRPTVSSPGEPDDSEAIDFLFWVAARHHGDDASALAYLQWEGGLPAQIERDGNARFRVMN